MSTFHVPREVHSELDVPFRTKPSSQDDVHWEPNLNTPWGWEQDKEPWEGRFRAGHLFAGGQTVKIHSHSTEPFNQRCWFLIKNKGIYVFLPVQSGVSAFHVPTEVHSVSAVPFRRKPSSQADVHWDPKLNVPWGWEQDKEPWEGRFRAGHLFAGGQTVKIHSHSTEPFNQRCWFLIK